MAAAHSVADILNAAQDSRSEAAKARCAGQLWKLLVQDPDSTTDELLECADYLLTISQKSPHVQHCITFFGSFASRAPIGSEAATAAVEALLEHVSAHTAAADKEVRQHACQLLHQLLEHLPAEVLQDDTVLDTVTEALTERLRDKLPALRAEAAQGLCHLIRFFEDAEDIIDDVTALLEGDKSKDVRTAVVLSLPLTPQTLPVLLERARDVSPVVRKKVAARLGGENVAMLSILQRATIMQKLLQDRDSSVAEAGRSMLAEWLVVHCKGDPLQLLEMLDVETYTGAAVCALEALISNNLLNAPGQQQASESQPSAIGYVRAATAAAGGSSSSSGGGLVGLRSLCQQEGRLLEPHEALLWRCLCEWLQTDAISRGLAAAATAGARAAVQAAVAAERHEALEAALPETADDLMGLIMRHTAAGPTARFAAAQLLTIAAKCTEWTDVASRDTAAPFLEQLIALDPTRDFDPATNMADDSNNDSDGGCDESSGLQLEGNGGDGMFESAVVQLVAAMQGTTAGFVSAMLDGIADLAAGAGLLRKPADGADEHVSFTVDAADTRQVLQVLSYTVKMLQRVPLRQQGLEAAGTGSISFASLWELLLLLALKSEHAVVRAKAVECIGAYAVVAAGAQPALLTAAVTLLGPLLAAEGSLLVRAAAVRALADIALLYGPAAVDSVLRWPAAGGEHAGSSGSDGGCGEGDGGSNGGCGSSGGVSASPKGLLELLVEQGQSLLVEAQAGGDKPMARRAGRPSTKAKPAAEDCVLPAAAANLIAVVAETLAKLLLHQRVWLRHYPHHAAPATTATAAQQAGTPAALLGQQGIQLPADSRQQQAVLLQGALALLLQLQFHPATAAVTEVGQRLSVFFDVFSAASKGYCLQLAAACLPAARQALHVKSKKQPAPLLAKYVLQLLQQARARREQSDEASGGQHGGSTVTLLGESFNSVAHMLLAEVSVLWPFTVGAGKQPALYKPYLSTLVKAVAELPLAPNAQDVAVLQSMANNLSLLVSPSKDATLSKDVAALQQHLQALADAAGISSETLAEDDLQQLMLHYRKLSLEQLPALPDGVAEAAAAGSTDAGVASAAAAAGGCSTARPRSGRGRASAAAAPARRRGRGRPSAAARRAAAASSSSGDDSSSDEKEDDSSSGSDAEGEDAAAAAAGSRRVSATATARGRGRGRPSAAAKKAAAAASSSSSDDNSSSGDEEEDSSSNGSEAEGKEVAAAAAPAASASRCVSAGGAASNSRRRGSAAAAAAAAEAARPSAAVQGQVDEVPDSEEFTTAESSDEGDGDVEPASTTRIRTTAAAAAASGSTAPGAVSELSDSENDSEDGSEGNSDDDSSSDSEQEAAPGVRGGKAAAGAPARATGARRQPLAPSSAANRRMH